MFDSMSTTCEEGRTGKTHFQLLVVLGLVVHLDLKGVDLKQLSSPLRLVISVTRDLCCVMQISYELCRRKSVPLRVER